MPVIQAWPVICGHDRRALADPSSPRAAAGEDRPEDPLVAEVLADPEPARAWSTAIRADVPVPHGERSIAPVHVAGRSQSSVAGRDGDGVPHRVRRVVGRPGQLADRDPGEPRLLGVDDRHCSAAAALIISVIRTMSAPSSGVSRSPNGSASAMT